MGIKTDATNAGGQFPVLAGILMIVDPSYQT